LAPFFYAFFFVPIPTSCCKIVRVKYLVYIYSILFINSVFAQNDTTLEHHVERSNIAFPIDGSYEFKSVDTILNKFYHYNPDGGDLNIFLGNPGLALDSMKFKHSSYGKVSGESVFNKLHTNFYGDYVYKTNIPFVRAGYIIGPKKLQDFSVLYTQNYSSRFNITAAFRTFGSDGFYLNQKTTARIFSGQSSFSTRKNRYGFLLKYVVKSGAAGENGGIKRDSANLSIFKGNKLGVQVELEQATNHYDIRKVQVVQYFNFIKSDTGEYANRNVGAIMLNTNGYVNDYWFEDSKPDSLYYNRFDISLEDTNRFIDKFHEFGMDNHLVYQYSGFKRNTVKLRFGAGSDWSEYQTWSRDTTLNETYISASFLDFKLGKLKLGGKLKKGVSGFNNNGYRSNLSVNIPLIDEDLRLGIYLKVQNSLPEIKYQFYSASELEWFNLLDYVSTQSISSTIISKKVGIKLEGEYGRIMNYTYYDWNSKPTQFENSFQQYSIKLSKKIKIKSYHFDLEIVYQKTEEGTPVNLPEWTWMASFYYQRYLFKGAMELRYGIDYWQNSKYYANNYAPFSRSFIYQNEKLVGDYPYLNFYVSARIKGAQVFINFQNLAQLLLDEPNYMMAPYYPMQDFGMSVGLKWDFYN
jgi:hypothetical protein